MRVPPISKQQIRFAQFGAMGFGVGLALSGAVLGALNRQITNANTGLLLATVLYGLAGALGGAMLGWADGQRTRVLAFALAGAIGCGLGTFLTTVFVSGYVELRLTGYWPWLLVNTVRFAVAGGFTGVLLGAVQRDWRQITRLALAGAVGFGLYYLVPEALSFVVKLPTDFVPGSMGEVTHDSVVAALLLAFGGAVGGAIGGTCLGIASAKKSTQSVTAGNPGAPPTRSSSKGEKARGTPAP
jgi:hypothetical protein